VGHWAARGKAYLVVLRPIGDVLTMQQLHFSTEVRPASEVEIPKPEVKPAELKLARQLIEQQTAARFEPTTFKDELRERVQAAIDKKIEGHAISVSEIAPESSGKVIDLMEALRASLQKGERTPAASSEAATTARKEPKRVEQAAKSTRKAGRR
jgi:DNA end-binding protein Ku